MGRRSRAQRESSGSLVRERWFRVRGILVVGWADFERTLSLMCSRRRFEIASTRRSTRTTRCLSMASAAAASHLRAALDAENFGVDGANAGAPSASDTADRVEAAARTELTTAALEAADSIAALHTFLTEQASPQVAGLQEQARNMDTQLRELASQAATKATTVEELSKLAGKVGSDS